MPPALEMSKQQPFACPAESEELSSHTNAVWHPQKPRHPPSPLEKKCVIGGLPAVITLQQLLHPHAPASTRCRLCLPPGCTELKAPKDPVCCTITFCCCKKIKLLGKMLPVGNMKTCKRRTQSGFLLLYQASTH